MINEGSSRYDAIKFGHLLKLYVNSDNGYAKSELSDMKGIKGEDLVEALDYANTAFEEDTELEAQYEKLEKIFNTQRKAFLEERENFQKLKENLEKLIECKEGSFIDKLKGIIKNGK
jgi:hypothetical protein